MSRVAKTAVNVPQGVDVTLKAESIAVKGALGVLELAHSSLVKV